jgi:hypothetical protein
MIIKRINSKIIWLELLTIFALSFVVVIALYFNIPLVDLTANPYSKLKIPYYMGLFQRAGIIIWCATVFITFFTSVLLNNFYKSKNRFKKFLLYSSFLFGYFMLDEIFLFHGLIIPRFLGIHQLIVLILYAIILLVFLIIFLKEILKTNYIYFFIAVTFLGLSVTIDILSYLKAIKIDFRYLLDDGFKVFGLVNLFIYYFVNCYFSIIEKFSNKNFTNA